MTKNILILVGIFFLFSLLFSGCERSEKRGRELVTINNVSISLEDFRQMSERQSLEGKMRLLDEKGQRDFLDNYVITREVLYQEAVKKGFDKKRELKQKVEDFKRAMIIDALLEEVLRSKGEVTDSEIEQYFKKNQEQFTEPQEVRIRHIVVATEPILHEVLVKLSSGEPFEKLASHYNIDRSKEDGGNLGYIQRGQLSPAFAQFEEAAFSLKTKGERSGVVQTPYGFHILQLEDKKGAILRPLKQVKEKIRLFLHVKKRQDAYLEYVKDTKSRAKIVINEKLWAEEGKKDLKLKEEKK